MKKLILLLSLLTFALPIAAFSAETSICVQTQSPFGGQNCVPVSTGSPLPVTVSGGGGGGASPASMHYRTNATNVATAIKASAGVLSWVSFDNVANNAETCVQFYDLAAASVTVGVTAAKFAVCSPAQGYWDTALVAPINFTTAMSYAVTTTRGGSTAPSSAITVRFGYL